MSVKDSYTQEELFAKLLEHFQTHKNEWERAIAISYRLLFEPTPTPEKAVEGAKALLSSPGREKVPFEIVRYYGLKGIDPQADVRVGTPGFDALLLAGIDENTGDTYVMCAHGSAREREKASGEIENVYKTLSDSTK